MERIPITFETLLQHRYVEKFNFPIFVGIGKVEVVPYVRVFINPSFGQKVIYDKQENVEVFRTDWANFSRVEYMDEILPWYIYKTKEQLPEYVKIGFMYVNPYGFMDYKTKACFKAQDNGFVSRIIKIDPASDMNCFVFNKNGICLGFIGSHNSLYISDDDFNAVIPGTEKEYENATWNDELKMFLVKKSI